MGSESEHSSEEEEEEEEEGSGEEEEEEEEGSGEEEDDDEEEDEEEEEEDEKPKKRGRGSKKAKDPAKPKRAMSAYFLYSQAMRSTVKEENPDASFGEIAKLLAAKYRELGDKELKKWEKKADQDKIRYKEEMKHYVPMDDDGGGKKKKAKKDPNAPKRNMSAYFLYSVHIRPKVKEDNPDASFGEIAKLISEKFKSLSGKERKKWDQKAADDKARYLKEMKKYKGN